MFDSEECFEYVVIGSGFGGTISALTIANKLEEENKYMKNTEIVKKICILERGQWWLNPEKVSANFNESPIQEYLDNSNSPYGFFPYPDNSIGLMQAMKNFRSPNNMRGIYDFRSLKNIRAIAGSGVGGGSLIYFNVTERPDYDVFRLWPTEQDEYPSLNNYFEKAEKFLGVNYVSTYTALSRQMLSKAQVFQDATKNVISTLSDSIQSYTYHTPQEMNAKLTITDIPLGLFEIKNQEIIHPNIEELEKYSIEQNVCLRRGRCGLGCTAGSRHSLDHNLYEAIISGKPVELRVLTEVQTIEENKSDNGYRYVINVKGFLSESTNIYHIYCNNIILAAGSLGTTEILLRSKDIDSESSLKISDKIGHNFSTNGDIFGIISETKKDVNPTDGPLITSIARFKLKNYDDEPLIFTIEDLGIPNMMAGVFEILLKFSRIGKEFNNIFDRLKGKLLSLTFPFTTEYILNKEYSQLLKIDEQDLSGKLDALLIRINSILERLNANKPTYGFRFSEGINKSIMLFGMGRDATQSNQLMIDNNDKLTLVNDYDLEQEVYKRMTQIMEKYAEHIGVKGKDSLFIPLWRNFNKRQITAHPIGGCAMSNDSSEGVVNSKGQLFKGATGKEVYEGIYITDGSIIPSSLGINPSLTIAALSFRIAENIFGSRKYWP